MLFIFKNKMVRKRKLEGLCNFRQAEFTNTICWCWLLGFRSTLRYFSTNKLSFDAIVELQPPVFGSVQVPSLLKPDFHGWWQHEFHWASLIASTPYLLEYVLQYPMKNTILWGCWSNLNSYSGWNLVNKMDQLVDESETKFNRQ